MLDEPRVKQLHKMRGNLQSRFLSNCGQRLMDVRDFILPELGRFPGETENSISLDRRINHIIMSVAQAANDVLASGFQSGLTSPAQKWFLWRPGDRKRLEIGGVRNWFGTVEDIMYSTLAGSNFYEVIHGAYTELGPFGMFDVLMEEDEQDTVRFTHLPVGSFYWATDARSRVDTVVREVQWTARQLKEKYGEENLSDSTKEKLKVNPDEFIPCYTIVMPRKGYNVESDFTKDMPWAEYVLETSSDSDKLLYEGGYREFPHLVARWFHYGDSVYSVTCPGYAALPDIRQLQSHAKTIIKMAHKSADPPMRVPAGYRNRLRMIPGGQTPVSSNTPDAVSPLYMVNPAALQPLKEWMSEVLVPTIEGHFYKEAFMMFTEDSKVRSATEIVERRQEKMSRLGPIVERFQHSVLDPCLSRLFSILYRRGMIPPVPPELADDVVNIEYVSVLAQAQRSATRTSISALLESVTAISQVKQDVLDKIDFDQAVDEMHDVLGAPAAIIRSDDAVAAIRNARLEAAQAEQEAKTLEMAAGVAEKMGRVPMDPSTLSGKVAETAGVN